MTRLLLQLLLLLASCQAAAATTESGRGQRDMLRDGREELWHIGAAIVEDAQQPSRICNTRPQRVLPSIGFKPSRPSARHLWKTATACAASWLRPTPTATSTRC